MMMCYEETAGSRLSGKASAGHASNSSCSAAGSTTSTSTSTSRNSKSLALHHRHRSRQQLGTFTSIVQTMALCLLVALGLPTAVRAEDKLLRWYYNTPQGGNTFDILQCQSLTIDWSQFGDGRPHSVYRFPDEAAYDNCDFSRATELLSKRNSGVFTVSGTNTLQVTKMWYGSREGDDCRNGRMKAALKIRPLFQYKFSDRDCVGATVDVVKNENSVKGCRKRAKRRRRSLAVQYNANTRKCIIFSTVPTGVSRPVAGSSCEVATTSCNPGATLTLNEPPPAPAPPPPTPPPPAAGFTCARGFGQPQQVGEVVNPPLDEASGIVAGFRNPTTIYSHNDLTGKPELYALATSDTGSWRAGQLQGVFKMNEAGFNDYEDIAISPSGQIFAGDIGDNSSKRKSIQIYRVSEPDLGRGSYTLMDTKVLELTYPGGKGLNAECLMYDQFDDRLYIVTKGKGEIYRTPFAWGNSNAKMTLVKVGTLKTRPGWITGCDVSRNGREILMKVSSEVVGSVHCRLGVGAPFQHRGVSSLQGSFCSLISHKIILFLPNTTHFTTGQSVL